MPKLKPETQAARRDHILDAAMLCFARAGFHRTTMHDICKEAAVSPGALYVYFDSKEALIAGLCERDRAEFAERFAAIEKAPDFLAALNELAAHYFIADAPHKRLFVVEMGIESTRNPRICDIYGSVDRYCQDRFVALFDRLKSEGKIAPAIDIPSLAQAFNIIGDGLFWRRAVHPDFNAGDVLPTLTAVLRDLMNPIAPVSALESGLEATNIATAAQAAQPVLLESGK